MLVCFIVIVLLLLVGTVTTVMIALICICNTGIDNNKFNNQIKDGNTGSNDSSIAIINGDKSNTINSTNTINSVITITDFEMLLMNYQY